MCDHSGVSLCSCGGSGSSWACQGRRKQRATQVGTAIAKQPLFPPIRQVYEDMPQEMRSRLYYVLANNAELAQRLQVGTRAAFVVSLSAAFGCRLLRVPLRVLSHCSELTIDPTPCQWRYRHTSTR